MASCLIRNISCGGVPLFIKRNAIYTDRKAFEVKARVKAWRVNKGQFATVIEWRSAIDAG